MSTHAYEINVGTSESSATQLPGRAADVTWHGCGYHVYDVSDRTKYSPLGEIDARERSRVAVAIPECAEPPFGVGRGITSEISGRDEVQMQPSRS